MDAELAEATEIGRQFALRGHVVIVTNTDFFFLSHRATWASAIRAAGGRVTVVAADTGRASEICDLGFAFEPISFGRDREPASHDLRTALSLRRLLVRLDPDAVVLVATRAIALASLWRIRSRKTLCLLVFTGAGRAFKSAFGLSPVAAAVGIRLMAMARTSLALFQTEDNLASFTRRRLVDPTRARVVPGAGVSLRRYCPKSKGDPAHHVTIGFASRLFAEKGVYDFVEVARRLRSDRATFRLAGAPDFGTETAVSPEEIDAWQAEGVVEVDGHQADMPSWLTRIDVFVLPTFHQEGVPRVLLEAGAAGCALVTTDLPGCVDVVQAGAGSVVPRGDLGRLEQEIARYIDNPALAAECGRRARERVRDQFVLGAILPEVLLALGAVPASRNGD